MNLWEGLGTALVAAVVSLAVSFIFRALEARRVRWHVTGEAIPGRVDDAVSMYTVNLTFHNVGDGDAYGVISTRSHGPYGEWDEFDAARVASGDSFSLVMLVGAEGWDLASVALRWETSPIGRSKVHRYGPLLLKNAVPTLESALSEEQRRRFARRVRAPRPKGEVDANPRRTDDSGQASTDESPPER